MRSGLAGKCSDGLRMAWPVTLVGCVCNLVRGTTLDEIAKHTANDQSPPAKFSTSEAKYSSLQTLYTLEKCTPDLSYADCNQCLRMSISQFPSCCKKSQGARIYTPSCNIRYEVYPFYNQSAAGAAPPPPSPTPPPGPIPLPLDTTSPSESNKTSSITAIAIVVPVAALLLWWCSLWAVIP